MTLTESPFVCALWINHEPNGWSERWNLPDGDILTAHATAELLAEARSYLIAADCKVEWAVARQEYRPYEEKIAIGAPLAPLPQWGVVNNDHVGLLWRFETNDGRWANHLFRSVDDAEITDARWTRAPFDIPAGAIVAPVAPALATIPDLYRYALALFRERTCHARRRDEDDDGRVWWELTPWQSVQFRQVGYRAWGSAYRRVSWEPRNFAEQPGFTPCGTAVTVLRACYDADCRFFNDLAARPSPITARATIHAPRITGGTGWSMPPVQAEAFIPPPRITAAVAPMGIRYYWSDPAANVLPFRSIFWGWARDKETVNEFGPGETTGKAARTYHKGIPNGAAPGIVADGTELQFLGGTACPWGLPITTPAAFLIGCDQPIIRPEALAVVATVQPPAVAVAWNVGAPQLEAEAAAVAPVVVVGWVVSLPALTVTVAAVAPDVRVAWTVALDPLACFTGIISPVVTVGNVVELYPLAVAAAIQTQTVTALLGLIIGPVDVTATPWAPTVAAGIAAAPDPLEVMALYWPPTVVYGTVLPLPAVAATATIMTQGVATAWSVELPALAVAATAHAPTVAVAWTVDLPRVPAGCTFWFITVEANNFVELHTLHQAANAWTPTITQSVLLDPVDALALYWPPDIVVGNTVAPAVLAAAATINAPVVTWGNVVELYPLAAAATVQTQDVRVAWAVTLSTKAVTATLQAPTVAVATTLTPSALTATATIQGPTVTALTGGTTPGTTCANAPAMTLPFTYTGNAPGGGGSDTFKYAGVSGHTYRFKVIANSGPYPTTFWSHGPCSGGTPIIPSPNGGTQCYTYAATNGDDINISISGGMMGTTNYTVYFDENACP